MNGPNKKMKLKRANEIRNVEEFTEDEINELKNVNQKENETSELDEIQKNFKKELNKQSSLTGEKTSV
jgi:hypothetical protein